MILPWNRKEVYMGFDIQKLNTTLQALRNARIRFTYRTTSASGTTRNNLIGTFGENLNYSVMYYVYVHRDDFDQACYVIHQAR